MELWAHYLYDSDWDVKFAPQVDLQLGTLPDLAQKLEVSLTDRPLIIAHSKGGLVAKQAMICYPEQVKALIAVGTPFLGSPLSRLMPPVTRLHDLTPENSSLRAVTDHRSSSEKTVLIEAQWDQDVPRAGKMRAGAHCTVPVRGHNALLTSPAVAQRVCDYARHIRDNWI